ncbi:MAG: ATP-binding cassette domain-containing protein [Actinomycetota bacterium]
MSASLDHSPDHEPHLTPLQRLGQLLAESRGELAVLFVYTIITGIFALAVPLAAQSLVNTIAAGFLIQPLVVLTLLVLVGLLVAGGLRVVQLVLVERLQERVFARVALHLGSRIPRLRHSILAHAYAPELVNRFFDVLTVQKTMSKLLLDGLAAALQATVGLALIAFYNPLLLLFAFLVFVGFTFVASVLGIGGLRTSILESILKYRVAAWLEELARCQTSFKMSGDRSFILTQTDRLVPGYLAARREHFSVIFRQAIGNQLFQALAAAGTLGIGGWLVINRQLTLGQLVAAELIVVSVLAALDKLIRQAEQVFDLLTALDKIGHVTDLPVERDAGRELPSAAHGARVECRGVQFSYRDGVEVLTGLDLVIESGERVSLVGSSGAGKSTFAALLCGLEEPSHGAVRINGFDVRELTLPSLRETVSLVAHDDREIFEGTVEENVVLGRRWVTHEDVRWALELVQLQDEIARLPQGLKTSLMTGGRGLSHGQAQRLLIARAVVGRPQLLILDEAFTGIDEKTKLGILDALYADEHTWTIIDISHDAEVVMRSGTIHLLEAGRIQESGPPHLLALRFDSRFCTLFPDVRREKGGGGGAGRRGLLLDQIPGLGPARVAALEAAGVASVEALAALDPQTLRDLPGVGPHVAGRIRRFLQERGLASNSQSR